MSAIGIIGGVGPLAGVDLARKIIEHTNAGCDQEHINMYLISCPSLIPDRTTYLLNGGEDPAPGIQICMNKLADMGATAVGICCNTAHSPRILERVSVPEGVKFINMIESVPREGKVGLLATMGTIQCGIYKNVVIPCEDTCKKVHETIYNIKSGNIQRQPLIDAIEELQCDSVILGCTELPLAFEGMREVNGTKLIDPTEILAIELIKATAPEKLKLN